MPVSNTSLAAYFEDAYRCVARFGLHRSMLVSLLPYSIPLAPRLREPPPASLVRHLWLCILVSAKSPTSWCLREESSLGGLSLAGSSENVSVRLNDAACCRAVRCSTLWLSVSPSPFIRSPLTSVVVDMCPGGRHVFRAVRRLSLSDVVLPDLLAAGGCFCCEVFAS